MIAGQQHIVYIDGRGHVQELFVQPGQSRWQIRDVTDDIRAHRGQWAQPGALTTWWSTVDGLRHIAYIDQRGHIQDCYMQPGRYPWGNHDVTEDTGGPTAQPGALAGWWEAVSANDGTQHIAYIDDTTHVREAWCILMCLPGKSALCFESGTRPPLPGGLASTASSALEQYTADLVKPQGVLAMYVILPTGWCAARILSYVV